MVKNPLLTTYVCAYATDPLKYSGFNYCAVLCADWGTQRHLRLLEVLVWGHSITVNHLAFWASQPLCLNSCERIAKKQQTEIRLLFKTAWMFLQQPVYISHAVHSIFLCSSSQYQHSWTHLFCCPGVTGKPFQWWVKIRLVSEGVTLGEYCGLNASICHNRMVYRGLHTLRQRHKCTCF